VAYYPDNPFKYGTQKYRLYERLKVGPVTNVTIIDMKIYNSTGRISEIREYLKPYLFEIDCHSVPGKKGVFEYSISKPYRSERERNG